MGFWAEWTQRLRYFLHRRRFDEELDNEILYHLERRTAELEQSGLDAEEARLKARREFGNVRRAKESTRALVGISALESPLQDVRYGVRQLRRSPGFAVTAILSLALGIGANTAIFQLLNAVRLRSLPVREPNQLVEVKLLGDQQFGTHDYWDAMTYPLWEQVRDQQDSFSGVFAWSFEDLSFGSGESSHPVRIAWVSGDAFTTLGVHAAKGRLFEAADDRSGCAPTAVLGYGFWQRQFGGQESALSSVALSDPYALSPVPFQVVGVAEPGFQGLEVGRPFDLALPFCAKARLTPNGADAALGSRSLFWLGVIGRLKDGVSAKEAARRLEAQSPPWFEAVAPSGYDASTMENWRRFRLTAEPRPAGTGELRKTYEAPLWLLLGITGLVLVIACVNLANLLLARSNARVREYSVRLALGASRARVVGQLFWESLLIALLGCAAGTVLATLLSRAVVKVVRTQMEGIQLNLGLDWGAGIDWRVIGFLTGIAILTSLSFGLSSALYATRPSAVHGANAGARNATLDRRRFAFQRFLIATQIAVSLVLVISSFLFVHSFHNLLTVDPGFRAEGLNYFFIQFSQANLSKDAMQPFANSLLEQVRGVPGVQSAALTTLLPLSGGSWALAVQVPGHQAVPGEDAYCQFVWASPQYFSTMGIELTAGRDFTTNDSANSQRVLIVNEEFVHKYFGNDENPIGRTVRSLAEPNYPETLYEIVGVVKGTTHASLRDPRVPVAYAPDLQLSDIYPFDTMAVRSALPLPILTKSIEETLRRNPGVRITTSLNLRDRVLAGLARERLLAWMSAGFGAIAFVLAVVGLYGVVAYMVSARRNEVGIRMALGATQRAVVVMFLRQTVVLLLAGLVAGTAISLALSKVIGALLFGLAPNDPLSIAVAASLLIAAGLAASWVPARRSSRLDPSAALREE